MSLITPLPEPPTSSEAASRFIIVVEGPGSHAQRVVPPENEESGTPLRFANPQHTLFEAEIPTSRHPEIGVSMARLKMYRPSPMEQNQTAQHQVIRLMISEASECRIRNAGAARCNAIDVRFRW